MCRSKRWQTGWVICVTAGIAGLLVVPGGAGAADLKQGVEQLAIELGKSIPEGRAWRVAVTDFPDLQGITSDLGRYIAERLTTRLSVQGQKFRVIERRRLGLVLGELKFSNSDLVDPTKAKELGKMLGVEGLVVGSVSDLGNQVDVDARIIEIETNNILPGVSATLSKDQVVAQLLTSGRTGPSATPQATAPIGLPEAPRTAAPKRSGILPVGVRWQGGYGGTFAHLFSIEIVEGRLLRFNLSLDSSVDYSGVSLDNPQESAFVIDQFGRQHFLVQAIGLSGDRPVAVSQGSSKRFTLTFPLAPELESFRYQAILVLKGGPHNPNNVFRLRIQSEKSVRLADFN